MLSPAGPSRLQHPGKDQTAANKANDQIFNSSWIHSAFNAIKYNNCFKNGAKCYNAQNSPHYAHSFSLLVQKHRLQTAALYTINSSAHPSIDFIERRFIEQQTHSHLPRDVAVKSTLTLLLEACRGLDRLLCLGLY